MPQIFSTGSVVKLGIVHKLKRVLYSISLAIKLKKIVKQSDEHVYLHFHNQYNMYFFLKLTSKKLRRKVTTGYTVHSYIWFGKWEDIKDTVSRRYFQEVYCCQNADRVFVLNDIVLKMLTEHYGVSLKNIRKVINGVNTDVYNENMVDDDSVRKIKKKYDIEEKRIVFQVGSVCDRKNQLGTLNLLLPLMKKDKRIVFAYAGGIIDETYAQTITATAMEHELGDRVVYFGEVSPGRELNILYSLSDACVMNSKSEAFALVIAEALSVPRPIFINESIMRSLVFLGKNLGNGIIQIDNEFDNNLLRVLDDEEYCATLKLKGRSFIEREYSWLVAARMYVEYFR